MCRRCKLSATDLQMLTVRTAIEYCDEYLNIGNKKDTNEKVIEYADEVSWL